MNLAAIYHRSQDNYCYCLDEDNIVISLKTGYDVKKVTLYYLDPFKFGILGGNNTLSGDALEMTEVKRLKEHLYWSATVSPKYKRLVYYFSFENDDEKYYMYEDRFLTPDEFKKFNQRQQVFTFPWMNPVDIFKTPDWVNDTIWYQIFVERFCNGKPELSPNNAKPWGSPNKPVHFRDYYGGDIPGITKKMTYLKELGVTGLYLTPVCKAKSNHKYDTTSFTKIDPHFGNDEDMALMVKTAHKNGIRIMMDGVFNHTGELFRPWQDVLKKGPDSKYYDWFLINKWPFNSFGSNSKSGKYYTFGFFDDMPKLNTNNPKVIRYILKVLTSWVKKYDIDGIRLDVAGEISHKLCKEIRLTLKALKPDFYILGELWHDSTPWLRGDEYDSVMNYPYTDSLNDFWVDENKTFEDFEYSINRCFTMYPLQVNKVLFNLLDSHDTIRLITKLKSISKFYQQLTALFTMPGTVCIYYGTEIALEGSYDPDCRRCMPWDLIEKGQYYDRINTMKNLIALRKNHPALRSNNYDFVKISNEPRIISYVRTDDKGNKIMVVLNCSKNEFRIDIPKDKILFSNLYKNSVVKPDGVLVYAVK